MTRTAASTLAVHHFGGSGSPVLLVHGAGANLGGWVPFAERLSGKHQVLGVDLPGHGGSLMADVWSWEAVLADLDAVIALETGPEVVLVGHSLGGMLALSRAALLPAVAGAINIDGWLGDPMPPVVGVHRARLVELASEPVRDLEAGDTARARQALVEAAAGWHPAAAEGLISRMLLSDGGPARLRPSAEETAAIYGSLQEPDLWGALANANCLVGVVLASQSESPPWCSPTERDAHAAGRASLCRRLETALSPSLFRVLPGTHDLPFTDPFALADTVDAMITVFASHR